VALLLIGGDKTGDNRWYETFVAIADDLYSKHLATLTREAKEVKETKDAKTCRVAVRIPNARKARAISGPGTARWIAEVGTATAVCGPLGYRRPVAGSVGKPRKPRKLVGMAGFEPTAP
jgi:hypothetical protein